MHVQSDHEYYDNSYPAQVMERLKSIFKDEMRIPPVGDESLQGPAFGSDGNLAQMWTHFGQPAISPVTDAGLGMMQALISSCLPDFALFTAWDSDLHGQKPEFPPRSWTLPQGLPADTNFAVQTVYHLYFQGLSDPGMTDFQATNGVILPNTAGFSPAQTEKEIQTFVKGAIEEAHKAPWVYPRGVELESMKHTTFGFAEFDNKLKPMTPALVEACLSVIDSKTSSAADGVAHTRVKSALIAAEHPVMDEKSVQLLKTWKGIANNTIVQKLADFYDCHPSDDRTEQDCVSTLHGNASFSGMNLPLNLAYKEDKETANAATHDGWVMTDAVYVARRLLYTMLRFAEESDKSCHASGLHLKDPVFSSLLTKLGMRSFFRVVGLFTAWGSSRWKKAGSRGAGFAGNEGIRGTAWHFYA